MPDDNRFASIGVDDDEKDTEADRSVTDSASDSDAAAVSGTGPEPATTDTSADSATSGTSPEVDPAESGPAFEFDAVQQKAVYPRPESWDEWEEALDFEVKRKLRDHGVKDITGRELDDAIARTIPEVTDLIVEKALEARRQKFD
ncbi:hypothetical protein GCM10009037_24510 [Halarchaeum grantii]|uniref:Uncharacterized protein n=1 Tax=Halarchaeum grantii TaxID=1193105 RepID=A0A830FC57_9EURY|nr:hypothetical protein [Halarchaeum grantii]GGL39812.1 hypothetical protein GCM10009037_24510 [Halarchaeum grantii]